LKLHEQLRHETFHLWLPNAVNLSGNYDWFYEGFTIYQALRTGVELNQIRFEDYLHTVSRAYDLARNDATGKSLSLLEASNVRWSGSNNYVYAKGLLVAFLCDVALLQKSKGKRSLADIFRAVYRKHRAPAQVEDGNQAVLRILKNSPELVLIVRNYIEGGAEVEWREYLEAAGLEADSLSAATRLEIKADLNGRQKDLLNDLGYNQWRKLLQKKK
jgi:predicted metalloprotease with PDZ domain